MDEIVALCKRRGFIFPSSEIYGGLGSTYDYGHYGVLLKNNVKAEWWRAMLQERDDIVALDSAILQHPRVWEASGHLAGFTDPLVDCRTCKRRFRADQLDATRSAASKPSKRPGEDRDCDLTEARRFNLMFETHIGPGPGRRREGLPAPRDRAGDLHQLQERAPVRAPQAAVRDRPDRQVVPQRDHARQLHLPHARVRADGDGVLRPAGRGAESGSSTGSASAALVHATSASGPTTCACASTAPRSSRTTPRRRRTSSTCSRSAGPSSRGSPTAATSTSRQHAEFSGEKLEYFDQQSGERYVPHVIEPAAGADRATLAFMVDAYDTEEVEGRKRTVLRLHPRLAPVKVAVLPLVSKEGMPEQAREVYEEPAQPRCRPSTTRAARSASATAARTRSAPRGA